VYFSESGMFDIVFLCSLSNTGVNLGANTKQFVN
jgi:hypothetical protein